MGVMYDALTRALVPLLKWRLRRRARSEPLYAVAVNERWGQYQSPSQAVDIWLHAVSLGEARAARTLVESLRAQAPHWRWVFTHGTATGRAELMQWLRPSDTLVWQPWDTPEAVHSFMQHFRPRLGLILETEIWPNWVKAAQARGLPLVLVNARLSERSWFKARCLSFWSKPAYQGLRLALAQTQADAQRLRQAGVGTVKVLGNLKFDAVVDGLTLQAGRQLRAAAPRPMLMLASSREGEEALWADAWLKVRAHWPEVNWLIVPRHPQRFDEVAQTLQSRGLTVVRRSHWPQAATDWPALDAGVVVLGDSLGEMALYYGRSHLALMGGSFAPLGGQNLIEACACGCPVLTGPHHFNFAQATEWAVAAGAAECVVDFNEALLRARQWLGQDAQWQDRAQAALVFAKTHEGAARASVEEIVRILKPDEHARRAHGVEAAVGAALR